MAQLIVRNLEDDVKDRLRRRAEKRGHSMEEEVREILREAVLRPDEPDIGLGTAIANRFRGCGFEPGEIVELRGIHFRPATFDE